MFRIPFPYFAARFRAWLSLCCVLALAGCSPLLLVNHMGDDEGIAGVETVAYGDLPRQQLDVYRPRRPDGRLVVFLYGGGWQEGARADYRFVAQTLTRQGLTVVIPDYRLYPEVHYPAFVDDAARAVAWALAHARELGTDPGRVFLMGHSAGAHIATLLALDPVFLRATGHAPTELAGVIGLSTPADFAANLAEKYRRVFGDAATLAAAQPVRYVNPHAPPLLLIHGDADTLVWPKNSTELAARQRAAGGDVELVMLPGVDHTGTASAFIGWFANPAVLDPVWHFLDRGGAG